MMRVLAPTFILGYLWHFLQESLILVKIHLFTLGDCTLHDITGTLGKEIKTLRFISP